MSLPVNSAVVPPLEADLASSASSTSSNMTRQEIQPSVLATPSSTLRASEDLGPNGLKDLEKGGEPPELSTSGKEGKLSGEWDEDGVVVVDGIETVGLKGAVDPLS